ncbi:hypothetical protein [Spirosoma sp.]|uniref:hypothetical protein n=1 Tax=Spirosoma sp. TaxID=1899569 RepID=UPI00262661BD|nr:hypothetical protein [Spirosoma sp.]MCX6214742.1 hypothetical protein [Spirosoma sp.]
MKELFITVLASGMTTVAICQKTFILYHQDKQGFFAVSAGTSLPIGQFARCSPVDDRACMAGQGVVFSASAGYQIAGPVGVMIRSEQHRNTVNTSAMLDALYRNDTDIWTAKADNWSVLSVLAGPYVNIPMGRFSVDAHLLAGRALAVLPNTSMSGNFGTTEMSVRTTGSQSTAFALGGGCRSATGLGLAPHCCSMPIIAVLILRSII